MLTAGDEYPIHQTSEPIAYSGTDRNFYDRFFFNGYSVDGSIYFSAALGVYPHLNVIDCAFSVLKDGKQKSVFVSRPLNHERMETTVGPLRVEVLEPLKSIRLTLTATEGITFSANFLGRSSPIEEPRFSYRQGSRTLIDCTRMTQNGTWAGHLIIDDKEVIIDPISWQGTRDRSWGVRPIGVPDSQPITPVRFPQFYWLWTPVNFSDRSIFFHVNDDSEGESWNTRSVVSLDGQSGEEMADCQSYVTFEPNSRRAKSVKIILTDKKQEQSEVLLEPFSTFLMKGIGYGHPQFRHGNYQGEDITINSETYFPAKEEWSMPENLHIQALSKATLTEANGRQHEGIGVAEQLFLGPHKPSKWMGLLDA